MIRSPPPLKDVDDITVEAREPLAENVGDGISPGATCVADVADVTVAAFAFDRFETDISDGAGNDIFCPDIKETGVISCFFAKGGFLFNFCWCLRA